MLIEKQNGRVYKVIKEEDIENHYKCPVCQSKLAIRERKKDKRRFVGCSTFPKCYFSAELKILKEETGDIYKREKIRMKRSRERIKKKKRIMKIEKEGSRLPCAVD
jgi:ssDNA-binding Zn-finger/Zn-ribbon topoisomerase 1